MALLYSVSRFWRITGWSSIEAGLAVMASTLIRPPALQRGEHPVGLGAGEVVDIHQRCHCCSLARRGSVTGDGSCRAVCCRCPSDHHAESQDGGAGDDGGEGQHHGEGEASGESGDGERGGHRR